MAPPDNGTADPALPILPLRVAMRHTGLSARQIRHYESLGLIRPTRTAGNHRLYSEKDLERLTLIKEWLDRGLGLEGIKHLLSQVEEPTLSPSAHSPPSPSAPFAGETAFLTEDRTKMPVTGPLNSLYPVSHPRELLDLLLGLREKP